MLTKYYVIGIDMNPYQIRSAAEKGIEILQTGKDIRKKAMKK